MAEIVKDEFGPELIVKVYDPKLGMEGFLVIDNTILGPGKGGMRMTATVSEEEVYRLARTMTWKNALVDLPFGGAKSGIVWKGGSDELKKQFIQSFANSIKLLTPKRYIAGPDINTGEREMQWFVEATENLGTATGKPANLCDENGANCGIPHEFGSTGCGVAYATKTVAELLGINLKGATISIHGFGNVGTFAYEYLTEMGAKVVAIADKDGAMYAIDGFDPKIMKEIIKAKASIVTYPGAEKIAPENFWTLPVDIAIPASVTDVINGKNKDGVRAKIIIEAGNIPMRENIENDLIKRGIFILPDFVANSGGVISSYAEHMGYDAKKMLEIVKEKIVRTTELVVKESLGTKRNPREVALDIAKRKVAEKFQK